MALYTKKGFDVPDDAVRLDEESATEFMKTIIDSWANKKDTFFIKYGPGILSGLTIVSAAYFNNHYRLRLRLQNFGRFSTYMPIIVIPSIMNFLGQTVRVQQPVMIDKMTCPICLELRSVSYQLLTSVAYPLIMAPISGFMLATRYCTYNIPPVNKDPRSVWNLYMKFTKSIKRPIVGIIAIQALAASFITYKEATSVATVRNKLMQMESILESENK